MVCYLDFPVQVKDFDDKVVGKLAILVDSYGEYLIVTLVVLTHSIHIHTNTSTHPLTNQ